jgi:hypothetical protein
MARSEIPNNTPDNSEGLTLPFAVGTRVLTKFNGEPRVGEIVEESGDDTHPAWSVVIDGVGMVVRKKKQMAFLWDPNTQDIT